MSRALMLACASLAALVATAPSAAHADQVDPMACVVTVDYTLNNQSRLSYTKDFVVGVGSPFSDDFSTATRFRFFDARLDDVGGDPVVSFVFDADVSTFNAVQTQGSLKIKDQTHGESTSGVNAFFSSLPGVAGAHRTTYNITCQRAQ